MKAKVSTSTHRLNGLTVTVKSPPDPYRALLETATRDEAVITAELATLKPRCEELERRLSEVSRIREALSDVFGEAKPEDPRTVFDVGMNGHFPAKEATKVPPEKPAWVAEIESVLATAEKPMRCANIVRALQKGGHKLHGEAAYQMIYTVLRTNKSYFVHGVSGTWDLAGTEAK